MKKLGSANLWEGMKAFIGFLAPSHAAFLLSLHVPPAILPPCSPAHHPFIPWLFHFYMYIFPYPGIHFHSCLGSVVGQP